MAPERVFVIGGPGSGKTTLGARIGRELDLPVHHLDEVARLGGGTGPERSEAERAADVARILGSRRWVAEGVHLGWTQDLMEAADVIVWLDQVGWRGSGTRQVRRFVGQAFAEARRQRGWRRFFRFRDYARRLRDLAAAIPEARRYQRAGSNDAAAGSEAVSRAATASALARFEAKVIHCRTPRDVDRVAEGITSRAA